MTIKEVAATLGKPPNRISNIGTRLREAGYLARTGEYRGRSVVLKRTNVPFVPPNRVGRPSRVKTPKTMGRTGKNPPRVVTWHPCIESAVLKLIESSPDGMSMKEVAARMGTAQNRISGVGTKICRSGHVVRTGERRDGSAVLKRTSLPPVPKFGRLKHEHLLARAANNQG